MLKPIYMQPAPMCSFCANKATADTPTDVGGWAYTCDAHAKLRVGDFGSRIIEGDAPERTIDERRALIVAAVASGDFDTAEDLIGDGDISEWL